MKEIGGYLGFEKFSGKSYHSDALAFNSCRNALCFLIMIKGYRRIWLPDYFCGSVEGTIKKYTNIEICYYNVNNDFTPPDRIGSSRPEECVLIVNYYGILTNDEILNYQGKYNNLILDNTQSYFQYPVNHVDTIYSCRKYFGVPDGAYLYTDGNYSSYDALPRDKSGDRLIHLIGRFEASASAYYRDFLSNEAAIDKMPIMKMSPFTENLLCGLCYHDIIQRRKENYEYIHSQLKEINRFPFRNMFGFFQYPLFFESADNLRAHLIENKIYVPMLWQSVLNDTESGPAAKCFAKNILPLPIDHRYEKEDMEQIVNQIKDFWKKIK